MIIGGFQKFSMSDYPGKLSAIIFTRGCNFRCPYCHNPELVSQDRYVPPVDIDEILSFLETRKGKLDGITITGGEPTIHKDLPEFISDIKDMGFLIKLDTNGTNPDMVNHLMEENLLDYVAMDYKAPANKYSEVINSSVKIADIHKTLNLIKNSGLDYEIRTTFYRNVLDLDDIQRIKEEIGEVNKHFIQNMETEKNLDTNLSDNNEKIENKLQSLTEELEDVQMR